MDETTAYYADAIHQWVWSGLHSQAEVVDMLAEWLEDAEEPAELDGALLQSLVTQEFAAKQQAETTWPTVTDCDRLIQAFTALNAHGIIALHNAGYDMLEGLNEVSEALTATAATSAAASHPARGYCFYHGQDLARAIAGLGLWLAYGSLDDKPATKVLVGQQVQAAMQEIGLVVEWNGDPAHRMRLFPFAWQRRYAQPSWVGR